MPEFRTPQFQRAERIIQICQRFYGKPWTCTFRDCEAVATFLVTKDSEILGLWSHAASLIVEIDNDLDKGGYKSV